MTNQNLSKEGVENCAKRVDNAVNIRPITTYENATRILLKDHSKPVPKVCYRYKAVEMPSTFGQSQHTEITRTPI